MNTDVGEFLVGAHLKIIEQCDVVDYNARPPVPGLEGMGELDVIGLSFTSKTAFLCEVATHLGGLEYGKGYDDSMAQIRKKYDRQRKYALQYLSDFEPHRFMFWCPRVDTQGRRQQYAHRTRPISRLRRRRSHLLCPLITARRGSIPIEGQELT